MAKNIFSVRTVEKRDSYRNDSLQINQKLRRGNMGTSTDGQISYGVEIEEGYEFPWDEHGDMEEWWQEINGYAPDWCPFTEDGDYKEGVERGDPRISEYFDHKREWMKKNPLPVEIVVHCSYDYPMYIIAVPGTVLKNSRGYPEEFKPWELEVTGIETLDLIEFCTKHSIEYIGEPAWRLTSLWG